MCIRSARTCLRGLGCLGGLSERASAVLCTCLGLRLRLRSGRLPSEKAEHVGDASPSSAIACINILRISAHASHAVDQVIGSIWQHGPGMASIQAGSTST